MGLYSFNLMLNIKDIMIFGISRFDLSYEDSTIAYVLYEDLNRLPTWQDFKEVQEPLGYTEEEFPDYENINFIRILVLYAYEEVMKDENMRDDIIILAEDMVHSREGVVTVTDEYLIDENDEEFKGYREGFEYETISLIKTARKYIKDKSSLKSLSDVIKDKTELDLSHLTQD